MAFKCIVVDDEQPAIRVLENFIRKVPELELMGSFSNPVHALDFMKQEPVDLVFLDIQMPQLSGVEFMHLQKEVGIIIVSAYDDHAAESFNREAIDYLLKPVSFERFVRAVERAMARKTALPGHEPTNNKYIFVRTDKRIARVDVSDILFIEGLRNYVAIQTVKQKLLTLQSLGSFEDMLGKDFIRVHKSYIVALHKIDSIERQRIFIQQFHIPIGNAYVKQFMDALGMPR